MYSPCVARLLPFGDTSLTSNSNSVNDTDSNLSVNSSTTSVELNQSTSVVLLNAGSIKSKTDELTCLINIMDLKPASIGITESWLNANVSDYELSISNVYCVFRNDRSSKGGGVCLLVHNSLRPSVCKNIPITCEMVWVECKFAICTFRVCLYYRPPYRTTNSLPN